jgi:hypothetical protein
MPMPRLLSGLTVFALAMAALPAWSQDAGALTGPVRVQFTTTMGAFTIELDAARAPLSAANFVQYVRDKHYDGTIFHRVVGNFVVQGGGYLPDGTAKPARATVPN